ncbi:polymorphic toxin MafB class 1 [Neisseria meningitidis]|nr:polymorphic toxin MafB class 1 [Neisseria meningitidis]MCL5696391.1 polymorphic toxin MafB class 1 [Neisseria meningitidis]MCL5698292.1 polymorphic toxin MafB class 1 [Neisseria meningitidis]MCL5716117.1 polymorphic toxin MafB class 1 [Neisseria meningitidis]MCL5815501.1 polymorphic toxin MafB class 1 [Neisseria meningitidis]
MKPLRRLTNLLAACAVAAAAFGQPALAADLAQDPFITDNAQRQHYEPGVKYHLFGDPRGSVSDRTGKINVIQDYTHQMGNLLIQQAAIQGNLGYTVRFSGHGHEEHAPFDNHAADSASKEQGNVDEGFTVYRLNWEGHEHHPADAYDGPKGGNYPKPTGARDEYTYHVNGTARSIKLNPTDTRSIRQRISDNYNNLGSNFSDRADEANRKMFEHNAKLDRWGNSMEFINGIAAGALNPFISAGEALGIGDILYGTRYAIDKAAMRNIAPLPTEGKFAVIGGLGSVAGFEKNTREAVDRWIQENPNAAETVEAVFNVAAAAKVAKLAKAAKPGKAAVSGDFSDSYKHNTASRLSQSVDGEMFQTRNVDFKAKSIGTKIHDGAQGKHISGHRNYIEGKSTLNQNINPQELLNGIHSGAYPVISKGARGNPVVDFGYPIGSDGKSGLSTNFGTIHSGKNGVHIVPANPKTIKKVQ